MGQPIEYIESMPEGLYYEYMALNIISPFTQDASAYREGLIATLLYNNNISKKSDAKTVEELLPYLCSGTPEFLEEEKVKKARQLLTSIKCQSIDVDTYTANYEHIRSKIQEEIDIESKKDKPDQYTINELSKLIS